MNKKLIFTKLNADLFQFLAKSLPNRTSRFDAFLYLYERQTDHPDDLLKYGINIPFNATFNKLAERWGWDRKTVMSFLKSLQKMGVIEVKRASSNICIHVKNLTYLESGTNQDTGSDST